MGRCFVYGGHIAIYSWPEEKNPLDKDIEKKGLGTVEELKELMPKVVLQGYKNPTPPQEHPIHKSTQTGGVKSLPNENPISGCC